MDAPQDSHSSTVAALLAIGALIGLGKLLASDEPVTLRKALGHSIVSAGLGGSAALILIPLPDVPLPVLIGAACGLASMGASTIALLLQRYIDKR